MQIQQTQPYHGNSHCRSCKSHRNFLIGSLEKARLPRILQLLQLRDTIINLPKPETLQPELHNPKSVASYASARSWATIPYTSWSLPWVLRCSSLPTHKLHRDAEFSSRRSTIARYTCVWGLLRVLCFLNQMLTLHGCRV